MKNLDDAIKHCEEVAEKQRSKAHLYEDMMVFNQTIKHNSEAEYYEELMKECIEEHRQLAEWLRNYKQIIESGDCNNCRNGKCEWKPLGRLVRYNCPHYVGISDGGES